RGETMPHVNQKGIFTADRRPKDGLYFYKASLSAKPVLHIAVNDRKYFAGAPKATQKIEIYSNLAEAELFLNGVSLGKKQTDKSRKAAWDVTLREGKNQLMARGGRGAKPVTDLAEINYHEGTAASAEI